MKRLYVHSLNTVVKMNVSTIDLQMGCDIMDLVCAEMQETFYVFGQRMDQKAQGVIEKEQIEMLVLISTI